jgi:pimeloyl-ACP methyl ester carboxylesterase
MTKGPAMIATTYFQSGRARLAAECGGSGAPLVLLHAGVADRRMWGDQLQWLSEEYRAVAYDRRGFGETAHADEPYSHVKDLLAVLDALSSDAAILVGCSQGGRIAIDTALAHPGRVRALVLVAPAVSGEPDEDTFPPPIQAMVEELERAEEVGDLDRINAIEAHAWLDGPLSREGRVGGALRELFLEMNGIALRSEPRGTELEPPSAIDRLHRITAPTLLIWGDLDFPDVQQRCRQLAKTLPNARACELRGTAHLPNLEQPTQFNRELRAFLSQLRA